MEKLIGQIEFCRRKVVGDRRNVEKGGNSRSEGLPELEFIGSLSGQFEETGNLRGEGGCPEDEAAVLEDGPATTSLGTAEDLVLPAENIAGIASLEAEEGVGLVSGEGEGILD